MADFTHSLLRANLGFFDSTLPEALDAYLASLLKTAEQELQHCGIQINPEDQSDAQLLVMYAAWLYRKRATGEGKPPMLTSAIRNRQVLLATGQVQQATGEASTRSMMLRSGSCSCLPARAPRSRGSCSRCSPPGAGS